jgi:glycosyltransferase involved in cell wall biosynthesis
MGCHENMKILCVIDSLGSGGAQRQMVNLACGLKENGHQVELFIYHPHQDFYRSIVESAKITINEIQGGSGFSTAVIRSLMDLLRARKYDAIISFLPSPNIYSILAKVLSFCGAKVIVSERGGRDVNEYSVFRTAIRVLYQAANIITVNSHHQAEKLRKLSRLRKKIVVVYNGYSMTKIKPSPVRTEHQGLSLLVVGRNTKVKNGLRIAQALQIFHQRNGYVPKLSWAGRQEQDQESLSIRTEMDNLISTNPFLEASWQWLGERSDIPDLLQMNDALIHVSLHEGLPNAVCEAFIAGRPVIASAVCDHSRLIGMDERGFLCDPLSAESICYAIERFAELSTEKRRAMESNARSYAEEQLNLNRLINDYEALLKDTGK